MVDRLSEQFASHKAFLETGGTQACEQMEIIEAGDLADGGCRNGKSSCNIYYKR